MALLMGRSEDSAGLSRRPNLLFIMSDQQRADTLDPTSPCLTPHLDRVARSGVRFSRCYAANPICSPSRASLLTGVLPHSHGMVDCTHTVEDYRASFDSSLPLWSQAFRDAGYRTGYFGKWHVERSNDLRKFGFDSFELSSRFHRTKEGYVRRNDPGYAEHRRAIGLSERARPNEPLRIVRQPGYRDMLLYGVTDEPVEGSQEHYVASRGIAFVREAAVEEPNRPWLLFLSTEAPHEPYLPPREYYGRYHPSTLPLAGSFEDDLFDRPAIYRRLQRVWRDMTAAEFAEAAACYFASCSLVDDQVGRLLAVLEETGQLEDTIIVYTSDHGDLMGAHRLMLKGVPAFEEVYRVPLLISGPGVAGGRVSERVVSLLDIAPTLTGLALGSGFEGHGRSLAPLLAAEDAEWLDEAYAEMHGQRLSYTQRILWRGRYKYVFNGFDLDELYDLENDPLEMRNLASDESLAGTRRALASRMWEKIHETGDFTLGQAQDGMYRFVPVGPEGD